MAHLVEKIFWHFFQFAEAYTFVFAWIVIPLGFWVVYLFLKRQTPDLVSPPVMAHAVHSASETPTPKEELKPPEKEPQVNKNLANA